MLVVIDHQDMMSLYCVEQCCMRQLALVYFLYMMHSNIRNNDNNNNDDNNNNYDNMFYIL